MSDVASGTDASDGGGQQDQLQAVKTALLCVINAERASWELLAEVLEKIREQGLQSWHAGLGTPDAQDIRHGVEMVGSRWYLCSDVTLRAQLRAAGGAIRTLSQAAAKALPSGCSMVTISPDMNGELIATVEIKNSPGAAERPKGLRMGEQEFLEVGFRGLGA